MLYPATLAMIWLGLPFAQWHGLLPVGLALVVLAVLLRLAELDVLFNLAKLFALTALGFWFLSYFETVAWAVLIAVLIPWVDAVSVWRGPTDYVISEQPGILQDVSIAFRIPGEGSSGSPTLGPPDILFFALFLAAASRFGLRVASTWLAMTALLGATLVLVATTDVAGLPALPAVCFGFLIPNADLIWRALRRRGLAAVRIYGRIKEQRYDLGADLIERSPGRIVILTREPSPRHATVAFDGGAGQLTIADEEPFPVCVHDLPNGVVLVPDDGDPSFARVRGHSLGSDEEIVERLKRERS